jgi:hypothetical protein
MIYINLLLCFALVYKKITKDPMVLQNAMSRIDTKHSIDLFLFPTRDFVRKTGKQSNIVTDNSINISTLCTVIQIIACMEFSFYLDDVS